MEAQPKPNNSTWSVPSVILQRRDLRGEAKLLYVWLWNAAGCRPATVSITKALLGAELGGSERAAGRWLDTIEAVGAIEIVDIHRGVITLHVAEPRSADAPKVARGDPQRELGFDQTRGETAAGLVKPTIGPIGSIGNTDVLPMQMHQRSADSHDVSPDGGGGGNAAKPPAAIGDVAAAIIGGLDQLPDLEARAQRVDRRVMWLQQQLRDPDCRATPLLKVAWAVERGRVKLEVVSNVVHRIAALRAACQLRSTPGAYFVSAMKKHFKERDVPWSIDKE